MLEPLYDIVVITSQHAFSGKLAFGDVRLSEFLNDRRETVLVLKDVTISQMDKPSQVLAHHAESVIPKHLATLVFEQQAKTVRSEKRFYSYVQKLEYPVYIVVDGIEMTGHVHTTGKLDLKRIVSMPEQLFLPVTLPLLTFRFGMQYALKPNTVMVNTARIQYIARQDEKPDETKGQASQDSSSSA